jgi:hypothetical protein
VFRNFISILFGHLRILLLMVAHLWNRMFQPAQLSKWLCCYDGVLHEKSCTGGFTQAPQALQGWDASHSLSPTSSL